ncbi:hypothetical protein [Streptomyces sp. BH104]|uniref:hypothetical protein n=1 Tax=unclassified Streptomyces TaxID=2593676 RepID=UPI003BB5A598
MSATDLTKAIAEARAAEDQSARLAEIIAVVQATQAATAPAANHHACSCSTQKSGPSAGTVAAWVAGGCGACFVLTGMFLAIALVAIAATVAAPIGYKLVRQIQKGK